MKTCDGCRFCCWSFGIQELDKKELTHCSYECSRGCSIYRKDNYPGVCGGFYCPYLLVGGLHRPDKFQDTIAELQGNLGGFIPIIAESIPVEDAISLIKATRTVMAAVESVMDNKSQWVYTVVPLSRLADGKWMTGSALYEPWRSLCDKYLVQFLPQQLHPWFTVVEA